MLMAIIQKPVSKQALHVSVHRGIRTYQFWKIHGKIAKILADYVNNFGCI